jgi:hypothetical protein
MAGGLGAEDVARAVFAAIRGAHPEADRVASVPEAALVDVAAWERALGETVAMQAGPGPSSSQPGSPATLRWRPSRDAAVCLHAAAPLCGARPGGQLPPSGPAGAAAPGGGAGYRVGGYGAADALVALYPGSAEHALASLLLSCRCPPFALTSDGGSEPSTTRVVY